MTDSNSEVTSMTAQPEEHCDAESVDSVESIEPVTPVIPMESFSELNLSQRVLESVNAAGFTKPTPIQAQFIPLALTGKDVRGQAKTGTGKTGSFLIPIFERLKPNDGRPKAIILAPTRELALQIQGEIVRLGSLLGFTSVTLYGGSSYEPQIDALAKGVDIIVGTPGRVMDHMYAKRLDLSAIQIAVLDEADRMLDLGFRKDIEYILKHSPQERQTLLLSATIPEEIKRLSKRFMRDPLEIRTSSETLTVDAIEQFYTTCERSEKLAVLLKILDVENPPLAIIFCGTKIGAKKLAERLKKLYISAREIHGDLQQSRREKIMDHFRSGKVQLLIATDVASRGIDVNDITHIINYDIPYKIDDYVHRIGRTGRMEKKGRAFTLVTREEAAYLTDIEQLINRELINISFPDLTSRWWPTPPSAPPEGYEVEQVTAAEAAPLESHSTKSGGGKRQRDRKNTASTRSTHSAVNSKEPKNAITQNALSEPVAATPVSEKLKTVTTPCAETDKIIHPHESIHSHPVKSKSTHTSTRSPRHQDKSEVGVDRNRSPEASEIEIHEVGSGSAGLHNPESSKESFVYHPIYDLESPSNYNAHPSESELHLSRDSDEFSPDHDTTDAQPQKSRTRSRSKEKRKDKVRGEPIHIVCSACGQLAIVRFKPDPARAIFCQTCYKIDKERRSKMDTDTIPEA